MTLTFNPLQAVVTTYSHAKVQCQRPVGSEDRVETNGRTDGRTEVIALPVSLMRSVNMRCVQVLAVRPAVRVRPAGQDSTAIPARPGPLGRKVCAAGPDEPECPEVPDKQVSVERIIHSSESTNI